MGRNGFFHPSIRAEAGRVLDHPEQNRLVLRECTLRRARRERRPRPRREAAAAARGDGATAFPLHHGDDDILHPAPAASWLLLPAMFARGSPKLSARLLAVANGTKKKCSPKCSGAAKTSPRSHLAEGTYNVTSLDLAKRDIPDLEDETLRQIEDREGFVDLTEEAKENATVRSSQHWLGLERAILHRLGT
ncbi:hypothetical protein EJB05_00718, partial [Eragrostis curvula]